MSSNLTSSGVLPRLALDSGQWTTADFVTKLSRYENKHSRKLLLELSIANLRHEASLVDKDMKERGQNESSGAPRDYVRNQIVQVLEEQGLMREIVKDTLNEEVMDDMAAQIKRFKSFISVDLVVHEYIVGQPHVTEDRKYHLHWKGPKPLPRILAFATDGDNGDVNLLGDRIEVTSLLMFKAFSTFLGEHGPWSDITLTEPDGRRRESFKVLNQKTMTDQRFFEFGEY